jgi:hypothetical protein
MDFVLTVLSKVLPESLMTCSPSDFCLSCHIKELALPILALFIIVSLVVSFYSKKAEVLPTFTNQTVELSDSNSLSSLLEKPQHSMSKISSLLSQQPTIHRLKSVSMDFC